jgi:GNAT superfamily N-acetyltransferase
VEPDDVGVTVLAPAPLTADYDLDGFSCGEPVLDEWLKRRALANNAAGASRTYVVTEPNLMVCGYYAIAAGLVARERASRGVRRNMPDPIPVLVLGRLAVDERHQGRRLGAALLKDAVQRAQGVASQVGVRALLVHALHDRARAFYVRYGFHDTPLDPMTLFLPLP